MALLCQPDHVQTLATQRNKHATASNQLKTGPEFAQQRIDCGLVEIGALVTPEFQPKVIVLIGFNRFCCAVVCRFSWEDGFVYDSHKRFVRQKNIQIEEAQNLVRSGMQNRRGNKWGKRPASCPTAVYLASPCSMELTSRLPIPLSMTILTSCCSRGLELPASQL